MLRPLRKPYLLLILLLPYLVSIMGVTAYFFGYQYRHVFQSLIRSSDDEELEMITLSKDEFSMLSWTEANREFTRDGKMYDVARVEEHGDRYVIYCEHDAFEDAVIAWMKMNSEKSGAKQKPMAHPAELSGVMSFDCIVVTADGHRTAIQDIYSSFKGDISTPPPRRQGSLLPVS